MNPEDIIQKHYRQDRDLYKILIDHSYDVAAKALSIAKKHPEMNLDTTFIHEAAILHDIGIFKTRSPKIHCYGNYPYICHGYLGSELLKAEGYPRHALVCERHTGTGLSLKRIIEQNLPLPHRDMQPESMEEQLICFADKFFSKSSPGKEKKPDKIRRSLAKHGQEPVDRFDAWYKMFM
ncbi:MAG: HDIG domain-containing protein [Dysgonamonadaceae bacterium]|nr:HDIG domain-containing protein [Dysgonamonadaceae bacterium]